MLFRSIPCKYKQIAVAFEENHVNLRLHHTKSKEMSKKSSEYIQEGFSFAKRETKIGGVRKHFLTPPVNVSIFMIPVSSAA